jgi:uncharacterized membrane protein
MENYYNGDGAGVPTKDSKTGDVVGQLGGVLISSLAGYFGGAEQGRKNRDLMNDLAQLSLAQQKELEIRLQDSKTETERQALAYKFLAVQKNNEAINKMKGKRYTSYIVLGVGVTILALVFLKLAKR